MKRARHSEHVCREWQGITPARQRQGEAQGFLWGLISAAQHWLPREQLLLAGQSSLKYLCDSTFGQACTCMRKDSYLVETRKFANVPCGAFCVLFCPDFPVKSSQYFFYLYFFDSYQFMGFFCICFSLCSFLLTFCCQFWDCSVFF